MRGGWWRTLGVAATAGLLALGGSCALYGWFGPPGALLAAALLGSVPRLAAGLLYADRLLRREHPRVSAPVRG